MWFKAVTDDLSKVPACLAYFNKEYLDAKKDVAMSGNLERVSAALPGQVEYRFNQLQELEAILEFFNIALRKERAKLIRKFMESYNRELSVRESEKWIDGEDEIVILSELINEIAYVRNNYLGILKSLEIKAYQVSNITRLRTAGIEDAEIGSRFSS